MQHCEHIVAYYTNLLQRSRLDDMSLAWRHHLERLLYDYRRGARDEAFARMFAKA